MTRAEFDALGIGDRTINFQNALRKGEINKAALWLEYIMSNPAEFKRAYGADWQSDRQLELAEATIYGIEDLPATRTEEEARKYLRGVFGFTDTKGFHQRLEQGKIKQAEDWLAEILANKASYPQYHMTWNHWKKHREQELADAKMTQ